MAGLALGDIQRDPIGDATQNRNTGEITPGRVDLIVRPDTDVGGCRSEGVTIEEQALFCTEIVVSIRENGGLVCRSGGFGLHGPVHGQRDGSPIPTGAQVHIYGRVRTLRAINSGSHDALIDPGRLIAIIVHHTSEQALRGDDAHVVIVVMSPHQFREFTTPVRRNVPQFRVGDSRVRGPAGGTVRFVVLERCQEDTCQFANSGSGVWEMVFDVLSIAVLSLAKDERARNSF